MLLCAALEIDSYTARELVGLPTLHRVIDRNPRGRLGVIVALIAVTALVAGASGYLWRSGGTLPGAAASTTLPPRQTIAVPIFNGGSDYNYARRVAGRVKALGYAVPSVTARRKLHVQGDSGVLQPRAPARSPTARRRAVRAGQGASGRLAAEPGRRDRRARRA